MSTHQRKTSELKPRDLIDMGEVGVHAVISVTEQSNGRWWIRTADNADYYGSTTECAGDREWTVVGQKHGTMRRTTTPLERMLSL